MEKPLEIILAIPGAWQTRSDIIASIANQSDGFLFAGDVIMHVETKQGFKVEICEHDPRLRQSFALAGTRSLTEADLNEVASHTYTLYLRGPGGSLDMARSMMNVACGVLKAGGIAVKVETSGVAHGAQAWLNFAEDEEATALYDGYVTIIEKSRGTYCSWGMHNLGLCDAIVSANLSYENASRLLETFLLYVLLEDPLLREGDTFCEDVNAPHYQLTYETGSTQLLDDFFHNPYGLWRLSPVR